MIFEVLFIDVLALRFLQKENGKKYTERANEWKEIHARMHIYSFGHDWIKFHHQKHEKTDQR